MSSPASCAAIRCKVANPTETRFIDGEGEWILGHAVSLNPSWHGKVRLAKMAAIVISECLREVRLDEWPEIPLLLCLAEKDRPGRPIGLDDEILAELRNEFGVSFSPNSKILAHGRTGVFYAMREAKRMLDSSQATSVLVAATDSLLNAKTLEAYERDERLLTATNSNGFMPGEAAAAILVVAADTRPGLHCLGLGFATECATTDSGLPLRGDGLAAAIKAALAEAKCEMQDVDLRITDLSGEQYYFKEASLGLSRILRVRREKIGLWHPAESIGDSGATAGIASFVVAEAACRKGYAPGANILCHASDHAGLRAASILRFSRS
jgi:3-oxoacyl-[acyl-carrier-protein] synthase-1